MKTAADSIRHSESASRYNQIVARALLLLLSLVLSAAWLSAQESEPPLPPEEDTSFSAPREYTFNPLQAMKELKVGKFYFKKGSFKAAALRAQEAIKWDDSLIEAYLVLGEAREKMRDTDGARKAYTQYLEVAGPEGKERKEIEKRLDRIAKSDAPPELPAKATP